MTEKRFILFNGVKVGTHSGIWDTQKQNNQRNGDELWLGEVVGMLNEGVMIAKENKQLKEQLNRLSKDNERLRRKNERLHLDWDKIYQLCLDKGYTEEEVIKELEGYGWI